MANDRFALADIDFGPLTDEELAGIQRHAQKEAMGMHEYDCAECGKRFTAYSEHRYKRCAVKNDTKIRMYCSYTCYRKIEKAKEEAFKKKMLEAWVPGDNRKKTPLEMAKDRLRKSKEGLTKAQKKKDEEWHTLSPGQRVKLNRRIVDWMTRLVLAEEELEALKANEGAGGVRGIASGDERAATPGA